MSGTPKISSEQNPFYQIQAQQSENLLKALQQNEGSLGQCVLNANKCFQEFLENATASKQLIEAYTSFTSMEVYKLNGPRTKDDLDVLKRQDVAFRSFYAKANKFTEELERGRNKIDEVSKDLRNKMQILYNETNVFYHTVKNDGKPLNGYSYYTMPKTFPAVGSSSSISDPVSSSLSSSNTSSDVGSSSSSKSSSTSELVEAEKEN